MAYMRKSKFRHVFGTPQKRDHGYDALRISKSSWDSTFCAVNPKFLAVIAECSGGGFYALPLSKVGRLDMDQPLVCGHTRPVLDIAWCPHNDNLIASGGEDCSVKLWEIPDEGLKEPMTDPIVSLVLHERRVTTVAWHPTAEHVLVSSGSDFKLIIWNILTEEAVNEVNMPEQLWSVSFNENGSLLACTCRDKKLRVLDPRTCEIKHEIHSHDGTKPQQVAFLKDNKIVTTGFSRMSERQYALWDVSGSEIANVVQEDIDSSNGVLFIFNDNDTGMFYLVGKGDSQIRYYEVSDESPYIHGLSLYQSTSPQRGIGYMPKRGVKCQQNEIARFYKLHNNNYCEVISFTVPRKSEMFQDDLYPDTPSDTPAISAEDYFNGKNAKPVLTSLRDKAGVVVKKDSSSAIRKSNLLEKRASKVPTSAAQSSNNAEAAAAPTLPPVKESNAASGGLDVQALVKEIEELKKTVQKHDARIQQLEEKVAAIETANTDEEEGEDA